MTRLPPFRPSGVRLAIAGLPAVLALMSACAPLAPVRHDGDSAATLLRAELAPLPPRAAPAPLAQKPPVAAAPAAPALPAAPPEPRFDLIVNGASTRDVFLSLVADTHYSMLLHPEVEGQLSLTLRGVTLREALESIRDVHGFEFRIEGRRITVYPARIQTRIFSINHLNTRRQGRSEVRVSGGGAPASTPNNGGSGNSGSPTPGQVGQRPDSSEVTSTSNADYWTEVVEVLKGIVGTGQGRHVIVSAHAGTIAVRGMPDELRQVQAFLAASRLAIERQVMLEAKIIEVELRDGHQSGIDWSYLGRDGAIGQTGGYAGNPLLGNAGGLPTLPAAMAGAVAETLSVPMGSGGTLGLALATKGFQAVMGFLETHGDVQVLSSPRIATLNNQKAVLKVGVDDYFLTNVSGGSTNTATSTSNNNGTTSMPSLTLTPFFSGVALDVTPQIDDTGMITLHVRPSVTSVTEKTRQIDLGAIGNYRLPLASSSVNESDTVVRVPDGQIVAIGGLMQSESSGRASGLPGAQGNAVTSTLFSNKATSGRKKELVVLIRPTIIHDAEDWERTTAQALGQLDPREPRRVITVGPAAKTAATAAPAAPATALPAAAPVPAPAAATVSTAAAVAAAAPAAETAAAAVAPPAKPKASAKRNKPRSVAQHGRKSTATKTASKPAAPPVAAPPANPAPAVVAAAAPPTLLARLWPVRW